ncbi:ribonuclease P protein subunit [Candidatus Woesearchaeota archaeon]|nr:ribonuclease P protein subunit [Candidatus Woesearchaeota archaeon]
MHHPDEFIGQELEVLQAQNKNLQGFKGRIIDETKKTFKIITQGEEEKMILKSQCTFKITTKEGKQEIINGSDLEQRPEERIKSRR